MDDEKTRIKNYVANALPQGKVLDLCFHGKNPSNEKWFTAKGRVLFGKGREVKVYFLLKDSLSLAAIKDTIAMLEWVGRDSPDEHVKILLTEYLSKKAQEMLRKSEIGFIDSVGNAWIDSKNLLIDKRGNKPSGTSSHGRIPSVFADKATLVSRFLLYDGTRGIREISTLLDELGFSLTPGYVSKVINSLISEHYAHRSEEGFRLVNKKLFLEDWVNAYKKKRVYRSIEGWYYPTPALDNLAQMIGSQLGEHGVLTDRAGAHFVDPYTTFDSIDVLANNKKNVADVLQAMGASPVDRGANINLIEPHYSVSAFFGSQEVEGVRVASDIQLYLDLSHQPKRGLEAAQHLYQQRVLPSIKKDAHGE